MRTARGGCNKSKKQVQDLYNYHNSIIFEELEIPDERNVPLHNYKAKESIFKDTFLNTHLDYEGFSKYNRVFKVRLVEENIESKIIKINKI